MIKFRTEIEPAIFDKKIDHGRYGFSIGSCFAESIAAKMRRSKFPLESNPFGVMYNPFSIASVLGSLDADRVWTGEDLSENGGLWFSYDHHGSFSAASETEALLRINEAASRGRQALKEADYVIITFGTAWVFELEGNVVANCHKQPSHNFTRRRLSVEEIVERFSMLMHRPLKDKQVIFTVSPVRHLKDGFEENSLSKAILRLAVAELVERHPAAQYFPAFEIVNDDLRDYRFYGDDLVHPSVAAIDYVWEKFSASAFGEETKKLLPRIENIVRAAQHRPFNPDTEAYRDFCVTMLHQAHRILAENPGIDLSHEMNFFEGGR